MSSPLDRRRRNLFALGNGAATKQQGAKKKEGTQRCQSIILLSPGRSATDTISKTMVDSTPLSFCKEIKEFFGRRHPSSSALSECFSDNRNGVYIHVKPQHILLSGTKTNGTLQTPEAFFRAATHSGYRIVVVGWRDNQLACLVSSYEMKYKPSDPVAMQKFGGLLATFEKVVKRQNRALAAAMANHFKIVSINFNDIVQDLCGTSRRIAYEASCPVFHCRKEVSHTQTSHRKRTLDGRIGPEAAGAVRIQLTGTPYEWMLDLGATSWPKGTARPVPLLTDQLGNSTLGGPSLNSPALDTAKPLGNAKPLGTAKPLRSKAVSLIKGRQPPKTNTPKDKTPQATDDDDNNDGDGT